MTEDHNTTPATAESVPATAATPVAPTEKPTAAATSSEEDTASSGLMDIASANDASTDAESPTDTKQKDTNVRVHVSRRSTETGDSKLSKAKRRMSIRWPTTKDLGPGVHWYTPTMMILLGLAGLFGGLGHHLYNDKLDGQPVIDAQWPQRWGVAMAFFVKMTLVGAVQMAVKQRAWLTVKKRGFRVKTLDSIFHSCYDPAEFFNKDLFAGAVFPALLALLVWVLPLSAIASPSTLTATNGIRNFTTTCKNVSTLNFNLENKFGIDARDLAVDKQGMSFWDAFENTTSFYNQPSMDNRRNFQLSLLSNEPLQPDSPCPTDSNCTFAISFAAPSYKCEPRDDFGGMRTYNLSQMAPKGDLLFASYSSFEEDFVGRPVVGWNRTSPDNNTGIFRREPTLWVAWVYNTTLPATEHNATQWNTSYWGHQLKSHVMECMLWNSTYSYNLTYLQGKMNVTHYTVRQDSLMLADGDIMAPYMPNYMEWSGFHGTGFLYRTMLAGNISQKGEASYVITESDISQTDILDPGNGMAYADDLAPAIERSFHNVYLSFLADLKQKSQVFVDLPCEASAHVLVWVYRPTWLAVSYFIAVAVTFGAIGVGLHAIVSNGYVAQTNFSTFLTTTRNPDLDRMAEGSCLGAWPLNKELRHTRLRFGQTSAGSGGDDSAGGLAHAAFGFVDQVVPIEKGKKYA